MTLNAPNFIRAIQQQQQFRQLIGNRQARQLEPIRAIQRVAY